MMRFLTYSDRAAACAALAEMIGYELQESLKSRERTTFCVPGGTTPGPVFDILAKEKVPWDKIDIVLNDERWVPETNPRSNGAQLRTRLLKDQAAKASFHPLYSGHDSPEEGAPVLIAGLKPLLPIGVLLVGMGDDMHTASLFPDADNLNEALAENAPILLPMRAANAAEPRITLSASALRDAGHKHLVIFGASKRAAFEKAQSLPPHQAPIAALFTDLTIHWAA